MRNVRSSTASILRQASDRLHRRASEFALGAGTATTTVNDGLRVAISATELARSAELLEKALQREIQSCTDQIAAMCRQHSLETAGSAVPAPPTYVVILRGNDEFQAMDSLSRAVRQGILRAFGPTMIVIAIAAGFLGNGSMPLSVRYARGACLLVALVPLIFWNEKAQHSAKQLVASRTMTERVRTRFADEMKNIVSECTANHELRIEHFLSELIQQPPVTSAGAP